MTRPAPAALITGSGRCGTGFIATVLRASGLNAGHEGWWTMNARQVPDLDVDVSWLGCFDHGYDGPVFAQVRDPWSAIPSLAAAYDRHPWRLVFAQNVALFGDAMIDAANIWHDYSAHAVDRARHWWRVEDVTAEDLGALGIDAGPALHATPPGVNARPRADFAWPDHPAIDRALRLGRHLGYGSADAH